MKKPQYAEVVSPSAQRPLFGPHWMSSNSDFCQLSRDSSTGTTFSFRYCPRCGL